MRLDYHEVSPEVNSAIIGLQRVVAAARLEPELLELVKLRASQLNGCAWCLDMHTKDARAIGMSEQRLYLATAWREAPCYSERERAALGWTEALTLLAESGAPDDAYAEAARVFSPKELVALTMAIIEINSWNRLNVGFRTPVGDYVSRRRPAHAEGETHAGAAEANAGVAEANAGVAEATAGAAASHEGPGPASRAEAAEAESRDTVAEPVAAGQPHR